MVAGGRSRQPPAPRGRSWHRSAPQPAPWHFHAKLRSTPHSAAVPRRDGVLSRPRPPPRLPTPTTHQHPHHPPARRPQQQTPPAQRCTPAAARSARANSTCVGRGLARRWRAADGHSQACGTGHRLLTRMPARIKCSMPGIPAGIAHCAQHLSGVAAAVEGALEQAERGSLSAVATVAPL